MTRSGQRYRPGCENMARKGAKKSKAESSAFQAQMWETRQGHGELPCDGILEQSPQRSAQHRAVLQIHDCRQWLSF